MIARYPAQQAERIRLHPHRLARHRGDSGNQSAIGAWPGPS